MSSFDGSLEGNADRTGNVSSLRLCGDGDLLLLIPLKG
jgi:hypothetical protein